ncbi:META domain-containing protein [Persicobacter psychrovividus]|uniref:DUF306 domain-containing protein n=1 Tax=Persicobacter psychrovividus TaxID=387638 RepID=A0ABN6LET5_9BACT|nr:hypothetical protein PEPS_39550 [Persicobacter psychrovividus]
MRLIINYIFLMIFSIQLIGCHTAQRDQSENQEQQTTISEIDQYCDSIRGLEGVNKGAITRRGYLMEYKGWIIEPITYFNNSYQPFHVVVNNYGPNFNLREDYFYKDNMLIKVDQQEVDETDELMLNRNRRYYRNKNNIAYLTKQAATLYELNQKEFQPQEIENAYFMADSLKVKNYILASELRKPFQGKLLSITNNEDSTASLVLDLSNNFLATFVLSDEDFKKWAPMETELQGKDVIVRFEKTMVNNLPVMIFKDLELTEKPNARLTNTRWVLSEMQNWDIRAKDHSNHKDLQITLNHAQKTFFGDFSNGTFMGKFQRTKHNIQFSITEMDFSAGVKTDLDTQFEQSLLKTTNFQIDGDELTLFDAHTQLMKLSALYLY